MAGLPEILPYVAPAGAALAALASWFSIARSAKLRRLEMEATRPFFTLDPAAISIREEKGYFIVELRLHNFGGRIAMDCTAGVRIATRGEDGSTILGQDADLPQSVPPGGDLVLVESLRSVDQNYVEHVVICGVRYRDTVLKREHRHFFVRDWPRGPDGKPDSRVRVTSLDDYRTIAHRYGNELARFLDPLARRRRRRDRGGGSES